MPPTHRPQLVVISTIGLAQILAWGSSFYLIAVLARPIAADTGWALSWIVGGLSLGFLVSGLVSPAIGRLIERHGGRAVLAASAVLLALGLSLLAVAPNIPLYYAAWAVLGVAMGAGLYEPAFATLARLYGEAARGAITQVTLFGGFASTLCWPLSALMVAQIGWRGSCAAYAAIHLLITLPLYWFGLPAEPPRAARTDTRASPPAARHRDHRLVFTLLAAGLTLAGLIMTMIGIHLLTLLQAGGLPLATAVWLGALVGPAQVGARILEMLFGRRLHPVWGMLAATVLVALGLGLLAGAPSSMALGILLYGAGSGLRSIARGALPLALFGRAGYAVLMGRLALPMQLAQAGAPFLGALLLDHFGATGTLAVLGAAAVVNIGLVAALLPAAFTQHRH